MVNRAECECGNQIDYITKDEPIRCFHCGAGMETVGKVGCVAGVGSGSTANPGLRELVDQWRYEREQQAGSAGYVEVAKAYEECADELEELIDDE